MKKKLFYLTFVMLLLAFSSNAQRVWDMGNNTALWPALDGTGLPTGTRIVGTPPNEITEVGGTGFAITASKVLDWSAVSGAGTYTSAQEFKFGGASAGSATSNLPTSRYFSFAVSGPTTIKGWFRVNGTGGRRLVISDGTNILAQGTSEDVNAPLFISGNYTGGAGTIYVYCGTGAVNIFKIESTDTALSTDSFQKESSVVVYAKDGKIDVSNVTSATKVSVYSVLGALVKSIETSADASLDINNGIYVVKVQSVEGEKTTKVIVQ